MNAASLSIIEAMDPISLSDMDSVSLMNRVDTKYVFGENDLQNLLENVKEDYRILTIEQKRISPYSTLYFDSPDHECFLQHHNGKLNRRKFRVREYTTTGLCFLEVKRKDNKGRTDKRRMPIPAIQEEFSEDSAAFLKTFVGPELNLMPQIWTNFSRLTLVDRNYKERVTLDYDLNFRLNDERKSLPGLVIAEIKQSSDDRNSLVRVELRNQNIRPLRVSKYCLGTVLLKPELKSNRFKSKLLAISNII